MSLQQFVLILLLISSSQCEFRSEVMDLTKRMDVQFTYPSVRIKYVDSLVDCQTECFTSVCCASALYDSLSSTCSLYDIALRYLLKPAKTTVVGLLRDTGATRDKYHWSEPVRDVRILHDNLQSTETQTLEECQDFCFRIPGALSLEFIADRRRCHCNLTSRFTHPDHVRRRYDENVVYCEWICDQ